MDRSDPQRSLVVDISADGAEAAKKTAADGVHAGPVQLHSPAPVEPPQDAMALTEAESDLIERAHFDLIERETTQPVRHFPAFGADGDFSEGRERAVTRHADAASPQETPPAAADSQVGRSFEPRPFVAPAPSRHAEADLAYVPAADRVSAGQAPRVEPAFSGFAAPIDHSPAAAAPLSAEPEKTRDWRDIARRAANVAFLVFAGWFVAVLLLIVAYRFVNPPFSMLMAQRFLTGTAIDKQWVPIDRISVNLSRAVIVAEDGRFCRHWGVDPVETMNAIRRSSGGYPRGASTITMQVAKNLFLVPTKSYLRKMVEIPLTFAIELVWSKTRILEVYLNIVEWGPGVFGAEAASRAHFGRPAAALSPRQAAQLAAVLPNPIVRNAGAPGPRTARKASVIQSRAARSSEASNCIEHGR